MDLLRVGEWYVDTFIRSKPKANKSYHQSPPVTSVTLYLWYKYNSNLYMCCFCTTKHKRNQCRLVMLKVYR